MISTRNLPFFAKDEIRAWAKHSESRDQDLLVKPSGSFKSRLAHRLNQPSYTTLKIRNGEVADDTNACIAMVMGNAYQKQHTLIYDQILRREKKSEALEHYPGDVIHCHETFIQKIRESSEAKVEVIHSVRVQKWMNKRPSYSYDMLPLSGDFEGASIALEHESNFKKADAGHRYRRILVFVYHPNRLFYRNEHESVEQDRLITVAAKIAQVEFVERYYKNEIWKELVPVDFRNPVMREQYSMYHTRVNESWQISLTVIP